MRLRRTSLVKFDPKSSQTITNSNVVRVASSNSNNALSQVELATMQIQVQRAEQQAMAMQHQQEQLQQKLVALERVAGARVADSQTLHGPLLPIEEKQLTSLVKRKFCSSSG